MSNVTEQGTPTVAPDYARRIYRLLIGVLVVGAIACIVVFGFVLPKKREHERIDRQNDELVAAMMCDMDRRFC